CKDEGEVAARRLFINPHCIPSLQSLVVDGSLRAQRMHYFSCSIGAAAHSFISFC
ncbi:U-box domain-containing protein 13-like, partial [Trifolium medium]|nr:U-box domain-containing protein 13-like [Trifolium medium]